MLYLTTAMAGKELGIQESRVRQLILAGRLKAEKLGGTWAILPAALEAVRVRKNGRPRGWRRANAKA
jgi:hypothetical protein